MKHLVFLAGLCLGAFALVCTQPGWPSVAALAIVLGFVGFVVWLNPTKKLEVKREEFDRLVERLNQVETKHKNLSAKIGFTPPMR